MLNVNNKPAIRNLANKSFRSNQTRNIIATLAIALTTLLFTSLFTMGIGTVESIQQATMRQAGGDGHAMLKYITDQQFDAVKDHDSIEEIAYARSLSDSVDNEALIKRRAEFWYYDEVALKLGFIQLEEGHLPEAEDEVIVDTKTLELLGIPLRQGEAVRLDLDIRGESVTREFVLSGWFTDDPVFNVGRIFTSRAYVDAHKAELQYTYYIDHSMTGAINAYVMFPNSMNLQGKLDILLKESGFSTVETDPNFLESNVNWSYLSTNFGMDAGTALGLGCGLLLIMFTGYLIIYNIFQISIARDIRFYGLLKTIGTTGKQIRRIIRRQALILCVVGIPLGLLLGFFSGKALVPILMTDVFDIHSTITVSANPGIFLGSALFAWITVVISTWKPGNMAGRVSPIEAVRYTASEASRRTQKQSINGAKMSRMAWSNIGRNKKRTALVTVSLSLSIILLNTVITLSGAIDMDQYFSKFSDTDFLIAHADYFNHKFYGTENQASEQMVEAVNALEGFEEGGRLYGGRQNMFYAEKPYYTSSNICNSNKKGHYFSAVYGLETLPMNRLMLIDGELDMEKLKSGNYILEGVDLDDNSKVIAESARYEIGETITLYHEGSVSPANTGGKDYIESTFTVLGHVGSETYINTDRSRWGHRFYLPAEVYKTLVDNPAVMSYAFNVADDKEASVEAFLKTYTDKVEPLMNFDSKMTSVESFQGTQNIVMTIGGALGVIMGIIGILNFINAELTGIVSRKREFAMMQSIGMTRKQLRMMLCFEGLGYAGLAGISSLVFGILGSWIIVRAICSQIWFMRYQLTVWPLLVSIPVLFLLGLAVPLVVYGATERHSIVERLREGE